MSTVIATAISDGSWGQRFPAMPRQSYYADKPNTLSQKARRKRARWTR